MTRISAQILATIIVMQTALLPALANVAEGSTARADGTENYNVVFHFVVKNQKDLPVNNVTVYFPIPDDDAGQKLTDFKMTGNDWRFEKIKDQFGQPIVKAEIDALDSKQQTDVGYSCNVALTPVRVNLAKHRAGQIDSIPQDIRTLYGGDLPGIYDINAPVIKQTAEKFAKESPGFADRVQAIHDYVASNITYNLSGHWSAAPKVLERKTGSCSEYSFLFSSLCRASGLPTRMVGSSHLRTTKDFPYKDDVWHRWVEVFVPSYGWVPFDPTIDRGQPPAKDGNASYDFRTLRVSRGDCDSSILGRSYVGTCKRREGLACKKYFVWTPLDAAGNVSATNKKKSQKVNAEPDAMVESDPEP